ncbi:MAG: class I SAM-dependent methyltransferase [Chloroflexi bacterium]|nr:class I SAM-dependent methyltransferase [Chloroflexota bacterium]
MIEQTYELRQQVIQRELEWHEQESHRRYRLDALLYDSPAFDPVVNVGLGFLQFRSDELVLDMGCGEGKETLALAKQGLMVISVDLSFTQLQRVRALVQEQYQEAQVHFVQANAEQLPFAPHSFRIIYGKAILHHLDLAYSAQQIQKLLQTNGRASFAEPMAHHPMIWLGRRLTPKLRTQDEHPLTNQEMSYFARQFPTAQESEFYLFTPISYIFRIFPKHEGVFKWVHTHLNRLDNWFMKTIPACKRFAWYKVVNIQGVRF